MTGSSPEDGADCDGGSGLMEPRGGDGRKKARRGRRGSARPASGPKAGTGSKTADRSWTRDAAIAAGLFALAALVRILFLRATIDKDLPFSIFYYGDSRVYREFALAILRGDLYDNGIPFHPPLFAWVLSRVIASVGENPLCDAGRRWPHRRDGRRR